MFLISRFVYDAMGKSKLHTNNPYLSIFNYSQEHHRQTFYKFRYGAQERDNSVEQPAPLKLKRGESAGVWSLEGFELSERVLALFGHTSELFLRGAELIHSPFIEPGFKGQLQLMIRNMSDQAITLLPGEVIGKVVFFDISDTILSAEDLLAEVRKNAQNQMRAKAIKELSGALGSISKIE